VRSEAEIREHRDKLKALVEYAQSINCPAPDVSAGIVMGLDWAIGDGQTGDSSHILDSVRRGYDKMLLKKRATRQ
jgi:hypothetical protein